MKVRAGDNKSSVLVIIPGTQVSKSRNIYKPSTPNNKLVPSK